MKTKLPMGRLGSLSPERLRRTARPMALTASSCETIFLCSSFSICRSRSASLRSRRVSGTPVILLTTSATTSSSTTPSISLARSRHSRVTSSFLILSDSALSRSSAARS